VTEYLNVGKIVNTQGIKGEVRVISKTDFSNERYKKGNELFLFQENKKPISLIIKSHRKHKNFDIVSFEDHPNINDVEKYRDGILKISKEEIGELEENAFYYHEIIGLNKKGAKDILIPYIESVVKSVDAENNRVDVEIPEGLID
jgi:16S rRNA processing protein RimM